MLKPGGEAHPLRPRRQVHRTPRPVGRGRWTPSPVPLRARHRENQLGLLTPLETRAPPRLRSPHLPGGRSTVQACAQVLAYLVLSGRAASTLTGTSWLWPWDLPSPLPGALPCWAHSSPLRPCRHTNPPSGSQAAGATTHVRCGSDVHRLRGPGLRAPSQEPLPSSCPRPCWAPHHTQKKTQNSCWDSGLLGPAPPNPPTPAPAPSRPLANVLSSDH